MTLRIVQISHKFPPHPGGTEYYVHKLSQFLARRGHDVTVLTTSHKSAPREEMLDGFTIKRCSVLASPLRNPISLELVTKAGELSRDADITHLHSVYTFTTTIPLLLGAVRSKSVITLHGRAYYEGIGKVLAKVYEPIAFRIARRTDLLIALTELDRDLMISRGIAESKIRVVPNFIDVKEFDNWARSSKPVEREAELQLVFVGNLVEAKGVVQLIEDLSQVDEDVGLWIIGEGPLEARIRNIARITKGIRLLGPRDRRGIVPYIMGADAVILPSKSEGFPTVALEALTLRKPLILSDIAVHKALFHQVAIFYSPGDPFSLNRALKKLRSRELVDLVNRGRRIVEEKYDLSVVGDQIESLYYELRKDKLF